MKATVLFLSSLLPLAYGGEIPKQKIALIQKAMEVMHVKSKMDGFIEKTVSVKAQRIQNDNPDSVSDSLLREIRSIISRVYQDHLDGNEGLYPQLYTVVDHYLTDDDLKFVMNYNASDGGQGYAKVAPRIVRDALEIEKKWSDQLEPVIREKLADRFQGLNFHSL